MYVGAQGNLLEEAAENCKVLKIDSPILTQTDILKIKTMDAPGFRVRTVSICYTRTPIWKKPSSGCSWMWTVLTGMGQTF